MSVCPDTTPRQLYIPQLGSTLGEICLLPLADDDAENLRCRVTDPKRDGDNLFTFLEVAGMPPTNNHAEQSLRKRPANPIGCLAYGLQ